MEAPQITAAAQIKNTRSCLKRPPREEDFLRVERFKPGFTQLWRELYVPVLPERLQYPKKRTGQPHRFPHQDRVPDVGETRLDDPIWGVEKRVRKTIVFAFDALKRERAKLDDKLRDLNEKLEKDPEAVFSRSFHKLLEKGVELWETEKRRYFCLRDLKEAPVDANANANAARGCKKKRTPVKETKAPQWQSARMRNEYLGSRSPSPAKVDGQVVPQAAEVVAQPGQPLWLPFAHPQFQIQPQPQQQHHQQHHQQLLPQASPANDGLNAWPSYHSNEPNVVDSPFDVNLFRDVFDFGK